MKNSWKIAPADSSIRFKVKYLRISNLNGSFIRFSGTVIADSFFENPEVSVTIEADSVETLNTDIDNCLRSNRCLDTDQYPYIEFQSNGGCRHSAGKIWELTGELRVKAIRAPVTLIINFSEIKPDDPVPNASFQLFGTIYRKDFDLGEPNPDYGDEIQLSLQVVLTKQS